MKDISKFETDTIAFGAMYILPNGTMLDLSLLPSGHADFWALLNISSDDLKRQGWVRLNTKLKYVELPLLPLTERQEKQLQRALDFMGDDIQIKKE